MTENSFENRIAADYLLDRQAERYRLAIRVIGLILVGVGLGYFGHWYFHIGGRLLLFPKSAPVYTISEIKGAGICRFRARVERAFSLLATALERESYKAEDATGKVKVEFPHKIDFQEKEVRIVGMANSQGNTVRAVWIGHKVSWNVALEVIIPIVLTLLGACFLCISFCSDHEKHLRHIVYRLRKNKTKGTAVIRRSL